jgi:hypothetical protein
LAPIPELAAALDDPAPPIDLVVDLDEQDRPTAVRFSAAIDGASAKVDVRFADWGADLDVQPPAEADIDRTPWVTEEALAALDPDLLVAPQDVADLDLIGATADTSDEECPQLWLEYASQADEQRFAAMSEEEILDDESDWRYLEVTLISADCAADYGGTDWEGNDLGDFEDTLDGRPVRGSTDYLEVLVGDVVVQLDNTLSDAEVEAVVRSLRPVTADALVARIPAWVPELADTMTMSGGPFLGSGFEGVGFAN